MALAVFVLVLSAVAGCPRPPDNNNNGNTNSNVNTNDNVANDNGVTNNNQNANGGGTNTNSNANENGGANNNTNTNGGGGIENQNDNASGGNNNVNSNGGSNNNSNDNSGPPPAPTSLSLARIAQTGDDVPGQPNGVTFEQFGNPSIDNEGRVAFWATYGGGGANGSAGLFVWNGSDFDVVVTNDPDTAGVVPNHEPDAHFGKPDANYNPLGLELAWGGGDRLLFAADITDGTAPSFAMRGAYRWRATDGNLARVADFEQLAELFPDVKQDNDGFPMFEATFQSLGITDAGYAFVGISYLYINTSGQGLNQFTNGTGVYTSNGSGVRLVADAELDSGEGDYVPDHGSNAVYSQVEPLISTSAAGYGIYQGYYDGGTGSSGVFLATFGDANPDRFRVIDNRSGASWPGLSPGAQVDPDEELYDAFAIAPNHIAIDTRIKIGSQTSDTVLHWDWDAGNWRQLTGTNGAAATDLLSGINESGQVVLLANGNPQLVDRSRATRLNTTLPSELQGETLTWPVSGGALNNWGRCVVRYERDDNSAGLVFWTGSRLLLVADESLGQPEAMDQFTTIVAPQRDRPGRSGLLSDTDQIVFRIVRTNDSEALYIATGE